jgi:hypothetical protein
MAILKVACLIQSVAVAYVAAQSTATLGTLLVTARDEKGAPLPAAEVQYRRLVRTVRGPGGRSLPAAGEAVVHNRISADAAGAAALPNLPAGEYALCGRVPGLPYLDPCRWGAQPRITVSANASTQHTIVLTKGVFLKVRINDEKGLLPRVKDGPSRAGNLIVGVKFRNGAYLGAENTGVDASGRDYQLVVPAGEPLKLWLFSRHVALTDAAGKAVDMSGAMIRSRPPREWTRSSLSPFPDR